MKNPHLTRIATIARGLGYHVHTLRTAHTSLLSISDRTKTLLMSPHGTIGYHPAVTRHFASIADSKILSDHILKQHGYRMVPTTAVYASTAADPSHRTKLVTKHTRFPLLLKPETGLKGRGIQIITSKTAFKNAIKTFANTGQNFLIQPIIYKTEYRILVIHGQVCAIHSKTFPTITGDGIQTVAQLLAPLNPATIDQQFLNLELKKRRLRPRSVLPTNYELAYHVTRKGDHAFTAFYPHIPHAIQAWSEQLCRTLGTTTIGVDVFLPPDFTNHRAYQIIEINANPGFAYLSTKYHRPDVVDHIITTNLTQYFQA